MLCEDFMGFFVCFPLHIYLQQIALWLIGGVWVPVSNAITSPEDDMKLLVCCWSANARGFMNVSAFPG